MKECGLYRDIQVCMNRLIIHIESLLYNMNNNVAEHYWRQENKLLEKKFLPIEIAAAVISFNEGPE